MALLLFFGNTVDYTHRIDFLTADGNFAFDPADFATTTTTFTAPITTSSKTRATINSAGNLCRQAAPPIGLK